MQLISVIMISIGLAALFAPAPPTHNRRCAGIQAEQAAGQEDPRSKPPSVTRIMIQLQQLFGAVRKQADDPEKNADSADKLGRMLELSVRSKPLLAAMAEDDKQRAAYRVLTNQMIALLAKAENAALQDDQKTLEHCLKKLVEVNAAGHKAAGLVPTVF